MVRAVLTAISIFSIFSFCAQAVNAQSCTAPAPASGVTVEYPGCNGSSCDLAQASCRWDSQADASSFNVTVTELETNTIIKNNESHPSSTTKIFFPITQGRTYKCDVVAVSSCGALAAASSDQLLCEADALIDTPTPTQALIPTKPPPTATPTIAPAGNTFQAVALVGGLLIVIIGGILLFVL